MFYDKGAENQKLNLLNTYCEKMFIHCLCAVNKVILRKGK